jgi:hypothetical protein
MTYDPVFYSEVIPLSNEAFEKKDVGYAHDIPKCMR